ncbi:hypothetical protein WMY93_020969 [Mugilogobius chulae]|uniref:Ly6/PLAUR domain-containing protein 1-like n=1 Tax=Mugilogobius chulae TaxID=88201 RepID=A0AAW0NKL1_9GOBI
MLCGKMLVINECSEKNQHMIRVHHIELYCQRYVDVGCSSPEVITCTHSHKGFKHRFCIKTESTALGIVLTSGCATSRHCQQQELPGVRIHCCDSDLCNSASPWRQSVLHLFCALASLVLCRVFL